MTVDPFPELPAGIRYSRVYKPMAMMDAVTYNQTFEDKGIAVNSVTSVAPQTWEFEIAGLKPFEADVYIAHYNSAFHDLNVFDYTEKDGTTHTDCRYLKFECSHEGHKSWNKTVSVTLIKYPS